VTLHLPGCRVIVPAIGGRETSSVAEPEAIAFANRLILHNSHRAIRFGDDPDLFGVGELITAQQSESMLQAQLVLGLIFLVDIAPVTAKMSRQEFER
jgi:hypothetical protein